MRSSLWLVDGYNVLRVSLTPRDALAKDTLATATSAKGALAKDTSAKGASSESGSWWSAERRDLLESLAANLQGPTSEVCLVFDGRHLERPEEAEVSEAGVRVVFAPSADDWIVDTVKQRREEPEEIRVVTADRALANRVRSRGAEVVATDRFLEACQAAQAEAHPEADPEAKAERTEGTAKT